MVKRFFSFLIVAFIVLSCGNIGKKEAASSSRAEEAAGAANVEFASLISNTSDFVGKKISIEGKVVHVCTHSGKKLFITGKDPDVRLYIQAGEEMPKFPMELLGSEIIVEGTLTKIVAAGEEGMHSGEGMHLGEGVAQTAGTDTCETEKALSAQPVLADLMMVYNKHTVVK